MHRRSNAAGTSATGCLTSRRGRRTVTLMAAAAFALTLMLLTMPAAAGNGQNPDQEAPFDVAALPISLDRIKRQLDRLPVVEGPQNVLRLSFYVRVYAPAPPIRVFEGFDLRHGPAPFSAPTHAEMRRVATPPEFRSRAVKSGSFGW